MVFAAILDGGTRLLGRVLPIGRGLRLLIVTIAVLAFLIATVWIAGVQLSAQAANLRDIVTLQVNRLIEWGTAYGLGVESVQPQQLVEQAMSSIGRLTSAVSTALGALTNLVMIVVIGLFIAVEPRLYERGLAWMLPKDSRERYYRTPADGFHLRRLMAGLLEMASKVRHLDPLAAVESDGPLPAADRVLDFLPISARSSPAPDHMVGFSAGPNGAVAIIATPSSRSSLYLIFPYVARRLSISRRRWCSLPAHLSAPCWPARLPPSRRRYDQGGAAQKSEDDSRTRTRFVDLAGPFPRGKTRPSGARWNLPAFVILDEKRFRRAPEGRKDLRAGEKDLAPAERRSRRRGARRAVRAPAASGRCSWRAHHMLHGTFGAIWTTSTSTPKVLA